MTPGDIIQTPSGRLARYEGGTVNGAEFVYLDATGEPVPDPKDRRYFDTFCLRSLRLLTIFNDQVVNGKRGVYATN